MFLRRPWRLDRRARALGDCRGGGGLNHIIVYVSSNQSLFFSTYVTAPSRARAVVASPEHRALSINSYSCVATAAFHVLKVLNIRYTLSVRALNAFREKSQRKTPPKTLPLLPSVVDTGCGDTALSAALMSLTQTARASPCISSDVGLYQPPRVGRTTGRGAEAFIHIAHRHAIAQTRRWHGY